MKTNCSKFDFSIIIHCHNDNFNSIVNSITKRHYDLKKTQLIIIPDKLFGSSLTALQQLQTRYPSNIVVVNKSQNAVSMQNTILQHLTAEYVTFCNDDCIYDNKTLKSIKKFFAKHTDIHIVCLAESGSNSHTDCKKAGIVDLTQSPFTILPNIKSNFYRTKALKEISTTQPMCDIDYIKVFVQLLCKNMQCGIIENTLTTTSNHCTQTTTLYLHPTTITNVADCINTLHWIVQYCTDRLSYVPRYFEHLIVKELLALSQHTQNLSLIQHDQQYLHSIATLCRAIDDNIINNAILPLPFRHFLFFCKYNSYPTLSKAGNDYEYKYNELTLSTISNQVLSIEFVTIQNNILHIEGKLSMLSLPPIEADILVISNNTQLRTNAINRDDSANYLFGFKAITDKGYAIDIAIDNNTNNISFALQINSVVVPLTNLQFGKFSPIGTEYKNSYYYNQGWLVTTNGTNLTITRKNKMAVSMRELKLLTETLCKKQLKTFICRLYYHIFKRKNSTKQYWLMSDRANKADDNGEVFFEYVKRHHKKSVKCKFVINKNCADYHRIKKLGKTISYASTKFKLQYLLCDMVVSSNGDEDMSCPLHYLKGLRDIVATKKFVFLQHGVIKDDLSNWLNKYQKNIYKFVTSTNDEYQSILRYNYYYTADNVILSGLPRYDKLYNNCKKQIVIMPTWRQYLAGELKNGDWTGIDNIQTTQYFMFYQALLTNAQLLECAKTYGYKIAFLPHPIINNLIRQKLHNTDVDILPTNTIYRRVFAESNLLVTDYSSVAFDFAYLKKPVVYCQFDKEEFFSGQHTYTQGYFDYQKDGFGEVCYNLNDTIHTIIDYIKCDCQPKQCYVQRATDTFKYNDTNNCQRVYEQIKTSFTKQ